MKGKKPKIFGLLMALVMALSLSLVAVPVTPAAADPGTLSWSEILVPSEDNNQLLPDSDVGPLAVSPDGGTIFAAVDISGLSWYLYRSTDGGYTWKNPITQIDGFDAIWFGDPDIGDTSPIVDVVVSPGWEDDDTVLVATRNNVFISGDRGVTFTTMGTPAGGWNTITSLDAALDDEGRLTLLAGDSDDVYLMQWPLGGWVAQNLEADEWDTLYNVLDVAFSPNFATDQQILCVAYGEDAVKGNGTAVMTKFGGNNWGVNVADAWFYDDNGDPIGDNETPTRASLAFPDDYSADPLSGTNVLFAGLAAPGPLGDVFQYTGAPYPAPESTLTDLNVRGLVGTNPTETNIWSMAVSGNADSALLIVGTEAYNPYTTPGTNLVYWSDDSGASWNSSLKRPTGQTHCYVVMGSPIAYIGTSGDDSSFSASTNNGSACNGRGLIDQVIDDIEDFAVSPAYATDSTMYMVTDDSGGYSLWQSTTGGSIWDRVLSSSLIMTAFDSVNLVPTYPSPAPCVFVAGYDPVTGKDVIWRSHDAATTFVTKMVPEPDDFETWAVHGMSEVWLGDEDGVVWWTTDGMTWNKPTESDIDDEIHSIAFSPGGSDILVGAEDGEVHISTDGGDTFERVGTTGPGISTSEDMHVAFDTNYDLNGIFYAVGDSGCGVQRWNPDTELWEPILPGTSSYGPWSWCNDNGGAIVTADDGTLYVAADWVDPDTGIYYNGIYRTVNPTAASPALVDWEFMELGRWNTVEGPYWAWILRVAPGSNHLFLIGYPEDGAVEELLLAYTDTLTGRPTLVSPADGSTSGDILEGQGLARVVLAWQAMTGATSYQYQVALDPDFGTIIDEQSGYTEGTVEDVTLWLGTTFYWRVRVGQEGGSTVGAPLMSQWSETWSFTTPLGPGAARPELESPEAGAQDVALNPVLEWTGLIDATHYELMVAKDCDWTNLVVDKTGASALGPETAYAITTNLEYGTDYCWKVRAQTRDAEGNVITESPWSEPQWPSRHHQQRRQPQYGSGWSSPLALCSRWE